MQPQRGASPQPLMSVPRLHGRPLPLATAIISKVFGVLRPERLERRLDVTLMCPEFRRSTLATFAGGPADPGLDALLEVRVADVFLLLC